MKRIAIISVLLLAALWSCSRNAVPAPETASRAISWQAGVNGAMGTKAYPEGYVAYPNYAGCTFGAYAMLTDPVWAESSTFVPYVDNQEVSYYEAETAWTTRGVYYWPQQGHLHFAAYSPYRTLHNKVSFTQPAKSRGIVITDFTIPTDKASQTYVTREIDEETHETEIVSYDYDLMVSDGTDCNYDCEATATNGYRPTLDNGTIISAYGTGYNPGVHTLFKHIMTRVSFRFQMDNTDLSYQDQKIYIKQIKLYNLYSQGSYASGETYLAGAWTYAATPVKADGILLSYTDAQMRDYLAPYINYNEDPVTLVDNYFAIPQPLSAADGGQRLEITYWVLTTIGGYDLWDKQVITSPVPIRTESVTSWDRGKSVVYTVTLAPAQDVISFTVVRDPWPDVADWNTFTITD